jgi:trimeric autotransporter adhesin
VTGLAACQNLISTVLADQQQVAAQENTQLSNEKALDTALTALQHAILASPSGGASGSSSGSGSGSTRSGGSASHTGSGGSGGTGSASRAGSATSGAKNSFGSSGAKNGSGSASSKNGFGSAGSGNGSGSSGAKSGSSSRSGASSSGSTGGSGFSGSGAGSGSGRVITAAQLAADQAQIDAANANVAVAQQNSAQATLTSPISGTVAQVGLTVGSSTGSSGITVIGSGNREVSTTVTLNDIDRVKIGDPAAVIVDGVSTPLSGKVSAIGILNTTTGSSTSYPVTVLLDPTSAKLYDGLGGSVAITTSSVSNVLTVPSSAVHTVGQLNVVSVLKGGTESTVRVNVGAVGPDRTEITSGLVEGQRVVLANLDEPMPSNSTNVNARRLGVGGTGGLGGAGGLGGGAGLGGGGAGFGGGAGGGGAVTRGGR